MELVNEQDLEMVVGGQGTVNFSNSVTANVTQTNDFRPGALTSTGGSGGAVTAASFSGVNQINSWIMTVTGTAVV